MMAEIFGLERTLRHTSNSRNIAKQRSCTQDTARNLSEFLNTDTETTNIRHHWETVDGDYAIGLQPDHEQYRPSRKKIRVDREFQHDLLNKTRRYSLRRKNHRQVLLVLPLVPLSKEFPLPGVRCIRGKRTIRQKRYPSNYKVEVKDCLGQIPLDEIKRAAKIEQIYEIFHLLSSKFKKNGNQYNTEEDNKGAQERTSLKECPKIDEVAVEEEVCKIIESGSEEGCCRKYDREQMQNMKVCLCSKVRWNHTNIVQDPMDMPPVSTSSPVLDFSDDPIICKSWEMFQEFTSKGGELRAENTDVVLCVPKEAIKQKLTVQIRGAISSDLHAAHTNLQLAQHERIVSPIAEFDAGQNFVFQKPVQVRLPHFLPPSFSQDYVHVYMFSKGTDGNIVEQLKLLRTSKAHECLDESDERSGTFYFTKTGDICILTSHFTGFVCTYCQTNIEPAHVYLSLFAVYRQQERKEVKICLFLWDKRLHMKDFQKNVMTDQEREMKSIKKGKLTMVDSSKMDLEVGARMILHENQRNNWIISNEDVLFYPEEQSEKLGDILCRCSNSIPVCIEWSLHDNPSYHPLPYFKCSVQVGYVPVRKNKHKKMKFYDNFKVRMFQVHNLEPKIPPDTAAAVSKCTKKNGQQVNIQKVRNMVVTHSVTTFNDSQSNGLEHPPRVLREITNELIG